jgi:hypothetical protein
VSYLVCARRYCSTGQPNKDAARSALMCSQKRMKPMLCASQVSMTMFIISSAGF